MHKIFRYPKFSETFKVCSRNFSALWDKKISIENLESPPPLLSINFLATGRFLKHSTEGFTYQIYRHCETKNFGRKNVIPPSMHKYFRYPKISETFKGCPRIFLALWDKKLSTEKRDTPFFIHIFFETKNFLKNSRISLRKFSALWDIKFSTGNRDMPPLIHKFFSIPENFRKTEGFLYKAFRFGPVRQKVPTKPWCPPPMHENFRWKNFSEAPKCSPIKYFNTVRQKPTENRDSPPLSKLFRYPKLLQQ